MQWQKVMGGTANDVPWCIRQSDDDGYIIAGNSRSVNGDVTDNYGQSDIWIVKLNSSVNIIENEKSVLNFRIAPNPFSTEVFISFDPLLFNTIDVRISDLHGREIKRINAANIFSNRNEIFWDARDDSGKRVEDGIYFITISSDKAIQTKKVVVEGL